MTILKFTFTLFLYFPICTSAQTDSTEGLLQKFPSTYFQKIDHKIEAYSERLSSKTKKTLTKLSRWEQKIHTLLLKTSPATADKLFAPGQPTFTVLLQKMKHGEAIQQEYTAQYHAYRDQLNMHVKYAQEQEASFKTNLNKIEKVSTKLNSLDSLVAETEFIESFIKERKRQLIQQSMKYIGESKYLKNINKDAYYYSEILRNSKATFSDPKKVEEVAIKLLKNIPGFKKFTMQNSQLSGLFASPLSFPSLSVLSSVPIVSGIPTRAAMQQFMQTNVPTIQDINTSQLLQGNVSELKSQIDKIKSYASGGSQNNDGLPDFKPNSQKAKPFSKRLEYSTDLQFGKSNSMLPSNATMALAVGYKFSDISSAGVGVSYALGMGKGWDSIRFSHQGIGFRSYLKIKLKKGFAIQAGSEWNYTFNGAKLTNQLVESKWQQSGLIGLRKSLSAGKKVKSDFQLYYDFYYDRHVPVSQPFVFRYGYSFGQN